MSTVYAHYEKHKDAQFKVTEGYGNVIVVTCETLDGGLNVGLFMQPEQLRMLVSAAADYFLKEVEDDPNG